MALPIIGTGSIPFVSPIGSDTYGPMTAPDAGALASAWRSAVHWAQFGGNQVFDQSYSIRPQTFGGGEAIPHGPTEPDVFFQRTHFVDVGRARCNIPKGYDRIEGVLTCKVPTTIQGTQLHLRLIASSAFGVDSGSTVIHEVAPILESRKGILRRFGDRGVEGVHDTFLLEPVRGTFNARCSLNLVNVPAMSSSEVFLQAYAITPGGSGSKVVPINARVWATIAYDSGSIEPFPSQSLFDNSFSLYISGTNATNVVSGSDIQGTLNGASRATFSYWMRPIGTWLGTGGGSDENVWMRRRDSTNGTDVQFMIDHGNAPTTRNYRVGFSVGLTAGTLNTVRWNGPDTWTTSPAGIAWADEWHHILFSIDHDLGPLSGSEFGGSGEGSGYRCWIDGVETFHSGSVTGSSGPFPATFRSSSAVWTHGATLSDGGVRSNFMGASNWDEFAVWPGLAMSSSQVAEVYNSGSPNNLNSLSLSPDPDYWFRCGDTGGDSFSEGGSFSNANGAEVLINVYVTGSGYSTLVP